ncbi:hypothetical protein pipiens_002736 [Culex pipiens pipiens]|uniref:Fibrinogen C-terminal domain-containing protein n=1 Tax=Culex pipiens pipiens TaxID=38569 RepID=A0ABD1D953_CULPP
MEEKMDNLQFSFMELFVHVKELGELFTNNQRTIEQNQLETNHLMNVLEDRLAANVSLITSYSKNWMAYRNGFGDVGGEFWLGLEKIYQLTKEGTWELIVEMKDFLDNYKYARYSEFALGNEREKYALSELGTYSGTAGDYLEYHKGMKFTTSDNDNDVDDGDNCAEIYNGAWWFKDCYRSHLNGQHSDSDDTAAIKWPNSESGLKFARMMIRKV